MAMSTKGPVALKNLVTSFDPNRLVAGRLIVIPVFTVSAFYADQRASAEDGINMNRAFPGKADGSISFRMARFLTDEVLSRADVVIDIHSGGRGYQIAPTMSFHAVDDPALKQQFKETAFLFGTPFTMIYTSGMGTGLLTEEAEKMGKITLGSELGYGASTDLDGVRWAYHGIQNVMRHYGLIDEPVEDLTLDKWGKTQRLIQNTDIDSWVTSPIAGDLGTAGCTGKLRDRRNAGGPGTRFLSLGRTRYRYRRRPGWLRALPQVPRQDRAGRSRHGDWQRSRLGRIRPPESEEECRRPMNASRGLPALPG